MPLTKAWPKAEASRIPSKAAKKQTRHWHSLVLVHDQQVALQKRPSPGIWGGLLAPLCFEDAVDVQAWCAQHNATVNQVWPARQHVFTHFTLHYTVHQAELSTLRPDLPDLAWYDLADLSQLGLPAPMKRLLLELDETLTLPSLIDSVD